MCKKLIFLVVLVLGFALVPAMGAETSLLSDSFESSPFDANWNDTNSTDWYRSAGDGNSHSGTYSAESRNTLDGDLICDPLDTSDAAIIKLDFWFMDNSIGNDDFQLMAHDGSVLQDVKIDLAGITPAGTWNHYSCGFIDSKYFHSNFQINLYSDLVDAGEYLWVDDVNISKVVADTYDVVLLDDGFEGSPWNDNWDDTVSDWVDEIGLVKSGAYSAAGSEENQGVFVCNALDTSDAAAVKVDLWTYKVAIEEGDFTLFYRSTDGWEMGSQIDHTGSDNEWLHHEETLVESKYFHTDFQIKLSCGLGPAESVYIDNVLITKRVIKTPYASVPNPSDGATGLSVSQQLGWKAGEFAKTHDVYFGTNESAVDSANKASDVFMGTQTGTTFDPNDPTSSELLADVLYYWRIDEANEDKGDPNYWKGAVWGFRTKPPKAENPNPWDESKYVNLSRTLIWTAGDGSIKHAVYFGTDETLVADSCDLVYQTTINAGDPCVLTPGLSANILYYWKIDSNTGTIYTEGDVWSFRTAMAGMDPNLIGWWSMNEKFGASSITWDISGNEHHGTLVGDKVNIVSDGERGYVLELTNPQYATLNSCVDCGGGGASWADIKEAITYMGWCILDSHWHVNNYMISKGAAYQMTTDGDDSMRAYMGGLTDQEITGWAADAIMDGRWHHIAITYDSNTEERKLYIDNRMTREDTPTGLLMEHADTFTIGGRYSSHNDRGWDGRIDDVRLYNRALSASEIDDIYRFREDANKAWEPYPTNMSVDVADRPLTLTWKPGDNAAGSGLHRVYFGTDQALVDACDVSVDYLPQDVNYLDVGELPFATPYYWRVDETDGVTTWKGLRWSFTMANFNRFDDFESYIGNNLITLTWELIDWTGGAINLGMSVNNEPVNGGERSMKYEYDNQSGGWNWWSETYRDFGGSPQDWTYATGDVKSLQLNFNGETGNDPDDMWVVLEDSNSNSAKKLYDGDMDDIKAGEWKEWDIDLSFATTSPNNVHLGYIKKFYIGFGERGLSGYEVEIPSQLTGTVYFDDFRIYPPRCVPDRLLPIADITEDCVVDYEDVVQMVADWLDYDYTITPSNPTDANLLGCWNFDDGTANDSSGKNHHGTLVTGGDGTSVSIVYDADIDSNVLDVNNIADVNNSVLDCGGDANDVGDPCWANLTEQLSVTAWFTHDSIHTSNQYMITKGNTWQITSRGTNDGIRTYYEPLIPTSLNSTRPVMDDKWHHIAITYDSTVPKRKLYLDGREVGSDEPTGTLNVHWDSFVIGGRLNVVYPARGWQGRIDDVRYYDDVLTHAEVVYLMTGTTDPVYFDVYSSANITDAGDPCDLRFVNFKDYDVLADNWLTELLWPSGW